MLPRKRLLRGEKRRWASTGIKFVTSFQIHRCRGDNEVKEKEEGVAAKSTGASLRSFAGCLGGNGLRDLGWLVEAERRLLNQPRNGEVRAPKFSGMEVGGQKGEGNGGGRRGVPTVRVQVVESAHH